MKVIHLWAASTLLLQADPLLNSWNLEGSGQYARIYQFQSDIDNQSTHTTWTHPNSGSGQAEVTYAGVHEVSYNNEFVYLRTSGLGAHVMGPWWRNRSNSTQDSDIFVNWPGVQELIISIPRHSNLAAPPIPNNRTETAGGAIGLLVDGVALFDSRDAFSYDSDSGQDEQPNSPNTIEGDGFWERDAYVNEGQTFDAAFAHPAGELYHYHANPPALRHQLGDSVNYDSTTHTYTEAANGKHSPILGWVRDGLPVYGPYGYSDPNDPTSTVRRMVSGYRVRPDLATIGSARSSYPAWATRIKGELPSDEIGPNVSNTFPQGHYLQDYEYLGDVGQTLGVDFDLDEQNTRLCVTPEFPNGVRAYFVSIEADGTPKFPYNIGRQYYSNPTGGSFNNGDARNNNDFITPDGLTIHAEGGPERMPDRLSVDADNSTGNVTLTWSGVEGGSYEVTSDTDLTGLEEMQDRSIRSLTDGEPTGSVVDTAVLSNNRRKFYRVEQESVAPFDASGFQLDNVTVEDRSNTVTVTLNSGGPADLNILPNTILFNGEAVEVLERPAANQITIYLSADLANAGGTVEVNFEGSVGVVTGAIVPSAPVANSNVLMILVDDWGIDSSPLDNPAGVDLPLMPNLELLASESVRFENAYVMPSCAPTRMAIMSGRLPSSTGVGSPGATATGRDATQIMTIAEAMDVGGVAHRSGLFGKWHLGNGVNPNSVNDQGPAADGWDAFFGGVQGNLGANMGTYTNWVRQNLAEDLINRAGNSANETGYATTVTIDDALDFINTNDQWLCWVALNAPHDPFETPPSSFLTDYPLETNTDREKYKAMLWALDIELKRLLDGVDLETTTVILLGDNGTPRNNNRAVLTDQNLFPRSHGKGTIYDGGVHVPFLIRPPGGTTARVESELVNGHDLFPTMCELVGVDPASLGQDLDGISILPILNNTNTVDRYMVAETFGSNTEGRTIRKAQYKLNIYDDPTTAAGTPRLEFFDLSPSGGGLQEAANDDLLRAGYTMSATELAAYNELLAYNAMLNQGEDLQFETE